MNGQQHDTDLPGHIGYLSKIMRTLAGLHGHDLNIVYGSIGLLQVFLPSGLLKIALRVTETEYLALLF